MNNKNIKKLPFYFEAEQTVLGIIFLSPKEMSLANDLLLIEDFFDYKHQMIFQTMKDLFKNQQDIDYISVSSLLKDKALLEKTGGLAYLIDLANLIPDIKNLETYINLIKEAALKRELIMISAEINNQGYNDIEIDNYLNFAEEKIFKLSQKRKTSDFIEIGHLLNDIKNKIINNKNTDDRIVGLKTGFNSLDEITLGFKPEEFIVLASRPSMGKSTFMMNLMLNMSTINKTSPPNIALFSLEMSNEQIGTRILSCMSKIHHKKIQLNKGLNQYELNMIELNCQKINKFNIFFDDSSSVDITEIKTKCRQLKNKNKLDILMIDYLQLIHQNKTKNNRQEEVSTISRNLKQIARELKIPVLALSQLSRDVEKREDKRPILSDLRDSGSIEQDADIVLFLYREDYYNKDRSKFGQNNESNVDLIISKNRQGILGIKKFLLEFSILRFTEIIP